MSLDVWISESPQLVPSDYKTCFNSPCECIPDQQGSHFEWYVGTGIAPHDHPLASHIFFAGCAACGSEQVLVIAAQWNVSYASGDAYWDYEIVCQECHKYTKRAYAD